MHKKKTAVVTGGSSGIGKSICNLLVNNNYQVINADINPSDTAGVKYVKCDITSADDVAHLSKAILETGPLNVLVLNAGRGIHEKIRDGDPEKWFDVINLNICGTLRVLRATLPFMEEGNVIFLSSVSALKPHPYGAIYAASKSAINTIAETLRLEEQPEIITTVISPGVVDTEFFNNMISGNHSVNDIGWGAISPDEIADTLNFILNQKNGTAINEITMRPAKQPL